MALTVICVSDLGRLVHGSVKVGHQRGDVLRGREPGVHVLAGVEEPARGDGDVLHVVTVEGEGEVELDGVGAPVGLGEHGMLLHDAGLLGLHGVEVDPVLVEVRVDFLVVDMVVLEEKEEG